jgi:hypothetical protein
MAQFLEEAPLELRTEEVLDSEHQLMLNRLNFELAERQRYHSIVSAAHRSVLSHCIVQVRPTQEGADRAKGGAIKTEQSQTCENGFRQATNRPFGQSK